MITPDLVMSLVSIIFVTTLSCQAHKVYKTKDGTSISYFLAYGTMIGNFIIGTCLFYLSLNLSAAVITIQGILWMCIGLLKFKYHNSEASTPL